MGHSTKGEELEQFFFAKKYTTDLDFFNFNFNSEQLTAKNIHLDKRICIIMHLLAYFDGYPSLKCHPCYHGMEPHFLNKIIIDVFFFFLHTIISFIYL